MDEAVSFLNKQIERKPKVLTFRNLLIDIYILLDKHDAAKKELVISFQKFGRKPSLIKRKNIICEKFINTEKIN